MSPQSPNSPAPTPGRKAYIPPQVEKAMAQHIDQFKPANVKQLEKSLPPHMKQYASAYTQQNDLLPTPIAPALTADAPITGTQSNASSHFSQPHAFDPLHRQSSQPPLTEEPATPPGPAVPEDPEASIRQAYDFIINPEQPAKQSVLPALPSANSTATRALYMAGGVLVLFIAFVIVKGILGSGPSLTSFVSIAQDQQSLIHLVTSTDEQQGLTVTNKNFAATAELSLSSSQLAIKQYLTTNKVKFNDKQLNLKISASTDKQLETAAAATTYNQTFQEIMKSELTDYMSDLQTTYDQTKGPKGRELLHSDYLQAQLLLAQLNTPVN